MRATGSDLRPCEPKLSITFDGVAIQARPGETIAAALTAHGIRVFRRTVAGSPRGLFCGMGVCQDCLVSVDGVPNQRACMTKITHDLTVESQTAPARLASWQGRQPASLPCQLDPDIVVVGGGAAGLTAAATAAENGASVVVVDERPTPGGQYFKQPISGLPGAADADDGQFAEGRALIARARAAGVVIVPAIAVTAMLPLALGVLWQNRVLILRAGQVIIATGAYERPLPVTGWTLPGVMTTGSAQTLLRSYRVLPGRRILVAGNGPLNLQVALELRRAGADVVGLAELAPAPAWRRAPAALRMALNGPGLVRQGVRQLAELQRFNVPIFFEYEVAAVQPGLLVRLTGAPDSKAAPREFAVDALCMGYGFLPNNELLRLFGCRHAYDPDRRQLVPQRDSQLQTSVPGVFAIGDCCGLGGVRAAIAEGALAGLVAAHRAKGRPIDQRGERERRGLLRDLARHRRFQTALWQVYAAPRPVTRTADVAICRCEEVTLAKIEAASAGGKGIGFLKRQTRLGMGLCQGRYCIPESVEFLCRRSGIPSDESCFAAPRPPLKPVPLGALITTED